MKAVGYYTAGDIARDDALVDIELPVPSPGPKDLLVRVKAVSVNPVDVKVRVRSQPTEGKAAVLGWDVAGIVESVGSDVTMFKPGDEVYYAGDITRPGANSEYHIVDERIVALKPKTLNWSEAAAVPLTAITAWELLFDRLGVPYGQKTGSGAILIINGAGGVGSILTQIARRLTGLTVIATASRPETIEWVKAMGAHHVINHHNPLDQELKAIGFDEVEYVAGLTSTEKQLPYFPQIIAPQGKLALIDDPESFDIVSLKRKAITVVWELMFTRPMFATKDMIAQHQLLTEVAHLIDVGVLKTTKREELAPINATSLKVAHARLESGSAIGKTVITGFEG